jgi:hypothetical protein
MKRRSDFVAIDGMRSRVMRVSSVVGLARIDNKLYGSDAKMQVCSGSRGVSSCRSSVLGFAVLCRLLFLSVSSCLLVRACAKNVNPCLLSEGRCEKPKEGSIEEIQG